MTKENLMKCKNLKAFIKNHYQRVIVFEPQYFTEDDILAFKTLENLWDNLRGASFYIGTQQCHSTRDRILEMYKDGYSQPDIVKELNVSRQLVNRIINKYAIAD